MSGHASNDEGTEGHAWNIVRRDKKYYVCDFTWNLCTDSYRYLCCDSKMIEKSHISSHKYNYP